MIPATIVCAVACIVLIHGEHTRNLRQRVIAKTLASLAFVAVGALAIAGGRSSYQEWILGGLVLGLVGDLALLDKRGFVVGLGAFLLGHVAYIVAIAQVVPPRAWLAQAGWLAALPAAVGIATLGLLWRRLGSLRAPVIAYVLAIVTMMIAALAQVNTHVAASLSDGIVWRPLPSPNRQLLLAGASLFFVSDLAVARDKFVGARFLNKLWGLPAYYAGQLLIAWSLTT